MKSNPVNSAGAAKRKTFHSKQEISPFILSAEDMKMNYLKEIISSFQSAEKSIHFDTHYLLKTKHLIRPEHRETLMLWLCAVCFKGLEAPYTIQFSQIAALIDQYLARETAIIIKARNLQTIGIAAMVVLADIENRSTSGIKDMVAKTLEQLRGEYPKPVVHFWADRIRLVIPQVDKEDSYVLKVTSHEIYGEVAKFLELNLQSYYFGRMILDSAIISSDMLRFKHSVIGFTCACLVSEFCSGLPVLQLMNSLKDSFDAQEIDICGRILSKLTEPGISYSLVEEKYYQKEFLSVARLYLIAPQDDIRKRSASLQ